MNNSFVTNLGSLIKWTNFLQDKLLKLTQEEIDNQNRLIFFQDIKSIINNLPKKKAPDLDGFIGDFYQIHFKKKQYWWEGNLFQKTEVEGTYPNSLYKASNTLLPKPDKNIIKKESYRLLLSFMNIHAKILNKVFANKI